MPEYKFELEKSDYYKHRTALLNSHCSPKRSEAKRNLGVFLSKVVFDQCEEALREDFGLKMPLKGPGDVLWVSPSDLLLGKIVLKPPLTPKCLQALTHKGIIEIGEGFERKFKEEAELDKQKTLERYRNELLANLDDWMKSEIKNVEIRERLACYAEMERMQQEFELILKEELDKLEEAICKHYEIILANHDSYLKVKWEHKLQKEVKNTVDIMTRQFLAELDQQEQKLTENFKLELKKYELLREFDAQVHKTNANQALQQLRHNLQCKNLVNMMYILCVERRKSCDQREELERKYKAEIDDLQKRIKTKELELEVTSSEKQKQIMEVSIREKCLKEVIKHFQKFINFALKSAPTQAEFLLSIEKMMVFELTSQVTKMVVPKRKKALAIIPWMHDDKSSSVSQSTIGAKDHHDCFHELNPPVKEHLDENDVLPAIYFKNKTYVREDFRDILTNGIPLSSNDELWNKDVEILINNWRQSIVEVHEPNVPETLSEVMRKRTESFEKNSIMIKLEENPFKSFDKTEIESVRSIPLGRHTLNKSTVQFVPVAGLVSSSVRSDRVSVDSRKLSTKSSLKPGTFPCLTNIQFESDKSDAKILAARDSMDLLMEKRYKSTSALSVINVEQKEREVQSVKYKEVTKSESKQIESKELVIGTRDSILMRMSELAKLQSSEFSISHKDSLQLKKEAHDISQTPSKLALARNSVELLRESLQKLRAPSLMCHKKDAKKQDDHKEDKLSFQSHAGSCCEKCKKKDDLMEGTSLYSGDERSVKISRIQIINLEDRAPSASIVSFNDQPLFIQEKKQSRKRSASVRAKSRKTSSRVQTKKKNINLPKKLAKNVCKIVGDLKSKEGDLKTEEFTAERIHSMVRLISDQPHLIQLFTAGIR
ncbi:hypothetical protein ABEB36_012123 [Hypothenemus hampei]|uniref:Uncharacterized protein n=1 Tax=Hypothenemus hampei TaxID=57062 RepID=A0ABD1EA46_HYPHA